MQAAFIESAEFTDWVSEFLPDDALSQLQLALMADPSQGDVIPGCGGLRKVRLADSRRGRGKRGGARVIYLHVPEARRFYLLDIYGKHEKDDLTSAEKKALAKLAAVLKKEANASSQSRNPS